MSHQFNDQTLAWLYWYRPIDANSRQWVEKIFTHGEIMLSAPEALNDPHEFRPTFQYEGTSDEVRNYLSGLVDRKNPLLRQHPAEGQRQLNQMLSDYEVQFAKYGGALSPEALAFQRAERKKIGVSCFSETWSNSLMWGHYASGHRGICIRLRAGKSAPFFCRAQRMHYNAVPPVSNPIRQSPLL